MNIPRDLKYSNDHEWLRIEGEMAYVGITEYAVEQLGDIVFVDVPTVGETLDKDEVFGSVEAVKTASDLLLPVGGEVLEFNEELEATPQTMNDDPFGNGWIIKIKMTDPSEADSLLDADGYKAMIGE